MSYYDVCDECGRHVAVAGHNPDCSNQDGDDRNDRDPQTGTDQTEVGEQ